MASVDVMIRRVSDLWHPEAIPALWAAASFQFDGEAHDFIMGIYIWWCPKRVPQNQP